ncbi:MAG: hypothetical protein ABIH70_02670 [Chloroflexota bacterium]
MSNRQLASAERKLKEYPNFTRLLDGQQVAGIGNLILTDRRLVFLHFVDLSDEQVEQIQSIAADGITDRYVDHVLSLDKKNFQLPLASVVSAGMGLSTWLPLRPCLRIIYRKRGGKIETVSFNFYIPLTRVLVQFELLDVLTWVLRINWARRKAGRNW